MDDDFIRRIQESAHGLGWSSARLPAMPLRKYAAMIRALPRPTPEQMQDFAEYVSHAHSWYKHRLAPPPGSPAQFYLDPAAGMDLVEDGDGRFSASLRIATGFHYSWLATAKYRARFGYLASSVASGRSLVAAVGGHGALTGSIDALNVYDPASRTLQRLPDEVVVAGTAWFSGIVHLATQALPIGWYYGPNHRVAEGVVWPEESGGEERLEQIRQRFATLQKGREYIEPVDMQRLDELPVTPNERTYYSSNLHRLDRQLLELVAPERRRQQRGMVEAIERVLRVVEEGPR